VSVGRLDDAGYTVTFKDGRATILNSEGKGFSCRKGPNGMYQIGGNTVEVRTRPTVLAASVPLHRRFVHADTQAIIEMYLKNLVDGLVIGSRTLHGKCENCVHGKT
ncbi:hypothetical protein B0H13DRAFT_1450860, partial [Mycena leptocephala]